MKQELQVGDRVQLVEMITDPNPVEPGTCGEVYYIGGGVANVKWDNGRNLGLAIGIDKFTII